MNLLPVAWLSLVKSCKCMPCMALVQAWAKADRTELAQRNPDLRARVRLELSDRETAILQGLLSGQSNKELAISLSISEHSVKNRLSPLMARMGVHDRLQAALRAIELGIVA